jgi:protein-disulfide isomerase
MYVLAMKLSAIIFIFAIFSFVAFAQTDDEILARANNIPYTVKDLTPNNLRESFEQKDAIIANTRKDALETMLGEMLLNVEASSRKTLVDKLLQIEVYSKVANPNEKQIQDVYDANKEAFEGKTLTEVKPRIVKFLRQEGEFKAYQTYIEKLKIKHKVIYNVDVNSPQLKQPDVLASFGTNKILVNKFDEKAQLQTYEVQMSLYEKAKASLEQTIYSQLIFTESQSLSIEPQDLIRREISDKNKDFSTPEQNRLQALLQDKLFRKYNYEFLLKEPTAPIQKIDTANAFSRGNANAPVTVVMFSDFQCSACSTAHPYLQEVLQEYGDKTRFVLRNFPLPTVHTNAMNAAIAAQAAKLQGKFYEYVEILYKNQDKLDIASLKKYASDLGLNRKQFDLELNSQKHKDFIKKDMEDGVFYGINSTPTIFVNGVKVRDISVQGFKDAIEKALAKAK